MASYFSFGRIIGYTSFFESIGIDNYFEKGLKPDKERLTSTERNFLCGLWLANIDLNKKGWTVEDDDKKIDEVLNLMDSLHKLYVNKNDFTTSFKELAFYEGDEGYDWQFIKIAKQKYYSSNINGFLLQKGYDVRYANSTYTKIKQLIEKQIQERRLSKTKKKEYFSFLNAFTLNTNKVKKYFTKEEQSIIKLMSICLGDKNNITDLNDIGDYNCFTQYPIIILPKERGLFIPNLLSLSISLNETPFYWLKEAHNKCYDAERGANAENIILSIIKRKFEPACILNDYIIKKTKTGNSQVTDIDILLSIKDIDIIFQIKSKRLTLKSKQGNYDSVQKDYEDGIIKAYDQGVKCVNCLKHYDEYYTLKEIPSIFIDRKHYLVVCITADAFPTITALSCQLDQDEDIPLIAMTSYDLDSIFDLLSEDEIYEYFCFRAECVYRNIIGINEMYYLGAFIYNQLGDQIYLNKNSICKEHAIFVDYLLNQKYYKKVKFNNINDIRLWLLKHPLN